MNLVFILDRLKLAKFGEELPFDYVHEMRSLNN